MAPLEFEFKHQSTPSTRSVTIGDISVSREPLIIDFSSTYPNNQEAAITVNGYSVVSETVNISGVVGNFLITDKTLDNGTFLFYEYQPLYDVATSGFKVSDEDGFPIPHKIEYAYIETTGGPTAKESFFLKDHTEIDYDPLSGHSETGIPSTSGSFAFAPVTGVVGNLGYVTHNDSLAIGRFIFSEFARGEYPPSGILDFTFLSTADSSYRESVFADDWSVAVGSGLVSLTVDGATTPTIAIADDTWYRGQLMYNENLARLMVRRDVVTGTVEVAGTIEPSGFSIDCDNLYVNQLALYQNIPTYNWYKPVICPRYHQSLRWQDYPTSNTAPYRVRILTEDNSPARITYDAWFPDGTIQQNRNEPMNPVPIYKESDTETNEWAISGNTLLLTGPISTAGVIYLKPLFEGFIAVNVIDEHVVVTNGEFKSSPYDTDDGRYTYSLLEYDSLMPFETDNQGFVSPRSLKESKYPASVLSAYSIKVLPIVVYEGRYPDYIPPLIEDIQKTVVEDVVTSSAGEIDTVTWRNTRGIRVYVNGTQLPQTTITGFDFNQGIVYLNVPVVPDDNVEVSVLRKATYYICNYPRMKPEIVSGNSWRIYLRSNYPNYFLDNPADTLERLAYRELEDGNPIGSMKSCTGNQVVTEIEGTIQLADISLVPSIEFTDARTIGGGLLPDAHFDSSQDRENKYRSSIFYSDIARVHALQPGDVSDQVPWPTLIVKIPSSVRTAVEARFSTTNAALDYIKKGIEKHIALGTYYIIVDENNDLWDKPFPSISPRANTAIGIELP
jgi:hypothetical protein